MSTLKVDQIKNIVESSVVDVTKIQQITSGITSSRPTPTITGLSFFDTTLGKPIWWNGSVWKDATGTTV